MATKSELKWQEDHNGKCVELFGRYGVFKPATEESMFSVASISDKDIGKLAEEIESIDLYLYHGGKAIGWFDSKEDAIFFARNKFFQDHPNNRPTGVTAYMPPSPSRNPTPEEIVAFAEYQKQVDNALSPELEKALATPLAQQSDEQSAMILTQLGTALGAVLPVGEMCKPTCGFVLLLVDVDPKRVCMHHTTNVEGKEVPDLFRTAANMLEPKLDPQGYELKQKAKQEQRNKIKTPKIILPP